MGSMTQTIFARNMGELRRLNSLTQVQVANFLGVAPSMVSRYENMEGNFSFPPPQVIDKIAELYQVHISDLFLSETAQIKKAEYKGASKADALIMLNKVLEEVGLAVVERKDRKRAG